MSKAGSGRLVGEGIKDLMRCSTCGETFQDDEKRCPTCGAVAGRPRVPAVPSRHLLQCPRCGYRGDAIPYFRKAGNVGLLAGLSFFSYGIGGVFYYAARRKHQVCARCGFGWEHAREPAKVQTAPIEERPVPVLSSGTPPSASVPLPRSGVGRRIVGGLMGVLATLIITAGILGGDGPPIFVGSLIGMFGSGLFLWGWNSLQERRRAELQGLHQGVLGLATQRDGILTVTEVATELNLSLPAAEALLTKMDDGFRVRSDISEEGLLYYEFPEVRHQEKLRAERA